MFTPSGEPTKSQLRVFSATSLVVGSVFLLLAWRTGPLVFDRPGMLWISAIFMPLGLLGSVFPFAVRGAYNLAMLITRPIGFVVANLILALLYFLVLVPIAGMLRLTGYDPLQRKPPATWHAVNSDNRSLKRYLRQY